MPLSWPFDEKLIRLGGRNSDADLADYGARQQATAIAILEDLANQPGVILADEVGMGKTYVALAVAASVLTAMRGQGRPVVVMMPPGLSGKWPREWQQFKSLCLTDEKALDWVRAEHARTPTEFFRLIGYPQRRRPHLIWMTTTCFNAGLNDPWIKLAFIRLARTQTKLSNSAKGRLFKWAKSLVRLKSHHGLQDENIEWLLTHRLSKWHRYLKRKEILAENSDDPVPAELTRNRKRLQFGNWNSNDGKTEYVGLATLLRDDTIPGKTGAVSSATEAQARTWINAACQRVYWQWISLAQWRASLLVLDEAHHAKNDSTRLAQLFRPEDTALLTGTSDTGERPLLWDKFDRMLFLTATPFQLGHQELIRVLRSFAAAKWAGPHMPSCTREQFAAAMNELEKRLDANRLAGRRLDRLWGRLTWDLISPTPGANESPDAAVNQWWAGIGQNSAGALESELLAAIEECRQTKQRAESDLTHPWQSLRSWVIRHNRPTTLRTQADGQEMSRRMHRYGQRIAVEGDDATDRTVGLPLSGDGSLPFLLAARAQGELAAGTSKARAYFAEGLCSSYEAFHHTREQRGDARDVSDDGSELNGRGAAARVQSLVPVKWYEAQIERLIPSKSAPDRDRYAHPKVKAVVDRALQLWLNGEKVLIFCFYRETVISLGYHIRREVEQTALRLAAKKLELDPDRDIEKARHWLQRISARLSDEKSPFHSAITTQLEAIISESEFSILHARRGEVIDLIHAYVRSMSFLARYLPLDEPEVREALSERQTRAKVIGAGVEALRHSLARSADSSGMTMIRRVQEFLRFAKELAERVREHVPVGEDSTGTLNPLDEYLRSVGRYVRSTHDSDDGENDRNIVAREVAYRPGAIVRTVSGATPSHDGTRDRLMLAFNSPLFPEILISSPVLAEGVDLHRFCRHVIHHDLCWNPSTLEQRTGRLDRIRCKAEVVGQPILIYEPFLGGSADEKMFRVLRDRERWFQVVMGQKFEFDEGTTEQIAGRVPLPSRLSSELVFDLSRYRRTTPRRMCPTSPATLARESSAVEHTISRCINFGSYRGRRDAGPNDRSARGTRLGVLPAVWANRRGSHAASAAVRQSWPTGL